VQSSSARADFYAVIPHDVMVAIFGVAGASVALVLAIGLARAARSFGPPEGGHYLSAMRDVLTLRHLHATGEDCTSGVEVRTPWRRYFHHCTFYGFAFCMASTTVAAVYHLIGWRAPYALLSAPVVLGVIGGAGLTIGPVGLLAQWRRRDAALRDPQQSGLDTSFIVMLLMTGVTGLLLLVLRARSEMPLLLVIHLGFVLALFLTLPYGKFVHGIYRTVALLKFSGEVRR
jgi:citrate/tricarballylate utilization protein